LCKIENFHKDFWSQILLYQKLSKVICDQKATISSSQENEFTDQIPGFLRFKCDVVLFCAISEEINVFFFFFFPVPLLFIFDDKMIFLLSTVNALLIMIITNISLYLSKA